MFGGGVLAQVKFADCHPCPPDSHFLSVGEWGTGKGTGSCLEPQLWDVDTVHFPGDLKESPAVPDFAQNEAGRWRKRKTEDLSKWSFAHHSSAPNYRVNVSWAVQ